MSTYLFKPHQKGSWATYLQYLQYLQDSQSTLITEAKSKWFLGIETKDLKTQRIGKMDVRTKM